MSEFFKIDTPSGYLYAHYTQVKIVKNRMGIMLYASQNLSLQLNDEEAQRFMDELSKFPKGKNGDNRDD